MFEFRPHNLTAQSGFEDRRDAYNSWFGADVDPTIALSKIVLHLGEALEIILGDVVAAPLRQCLISGESAENWREAAQTSNHSEWPCETILLDLLAFGLFGVTEHDADFGKIDAALSKAERLRDHCPIDRWLEPERADLFNAIIATARGRRNLERRQNVSPEALAHLGGVKFSRIQNMISGSNPDLPRDADGLVQHDRAAAWLASREPFLPTISINDEPAEKRLPEEHLSDPIFLPAARDGTVFHPGLRRAEGYQIGPKSQERHIPSFEEALAELAREATPRWRRPNEKGNWGIVSGVEWRRMDRAELKDLA